MKIRKTIIESLPTTAQHCNPYIYASCVKKTIGDEVIQDHGCSLPFLPGFDKNVEICGRNLTIEIITELFEATQSSDYKDCHDIQPCSSVVYSLTNPVTQNLPSFETSAKVYLTFESTMVKSIIDSYDYNSITIFSEIGGSVGVLTGISCMTIVELCLKFHKKLFAMFNKTNRSKWSHLGNYSIWASALSSPASNSMQEKS